MRSAPLLGIVALSILVSSSPQARADKIPAKYKPYIQKALKWLADKQNPRTGAWEADGGKYPCAMTGMAGMALLCEGSTVNQGKYAKNIRMARDYLMSCAMPNGLIGVPHEMNQAMRYMYGHGFGMLFLASVYGEETNKQKREKLEEILTKAAKFTRDAQTNRGGWGYVTAKDGNNFDEGSVTITQLQALRAARNAGIKVPIEAIKDAQKYLEQSTGSDGGVTYSLTYGGGGGGRPALTAAAICCGFSSGDYNSPLVKKWFKFCQGRLPIGQVNHNHDEYTIYYYSQAVYVLGDDGWAKLFPNDKESDRVTWKAYREKVFNHLISTQANDGSWTGSTWTGRVGQVYMTSCFLTVLQLDNNCLPIYQR